MTMNQGKDKCELLKSIRAYIAEKYGVDYTPSVCQHEGDCPGSCPKCDSELQDIQAQLKAKGIADIQTDEKLSAMVKEYVQTTMDTRKAMREFFYGDACDKLEEQRVRHRLPGAIYKQGDWSPPTEDHILEGDVGPQEEGQMPDPEVMSVPRHLFLECRIAGTVYHDIKDIWDELYEGAPLALVRDRHNLYDPHAVAVALRDDYDGNPEDFDFRFILGYIPRTDNEALAALLDMGWENLLEAEISEIREDGPMSERLRMEVYVVGNPDADVQDDVSDKLHMVYLKDDGEWEQFKRDLWDKGYAYYRWGGFPPFDLHQPEKNGKVVFIHETEGTYEVYLMKVIATDEECLPFVGSIDELHAVDDCRPFVLTNIYGPLKSNNAAWGTFTRGKASRSQPDHPISKKDWELFWNLLEEEDGYLPEPH